MGDLLEQDKELIEEDDTEKDQYMTFKTGREYFAIPLNNVNEIIGMSPITGIPDANDYVRGLINLRGKIIPVIDVRIRFRMEPMPYTDRTCIIVVSVNDKVVGLIVEQIEEVVRIEQSNIVPPPMLGNGDDISSSKFVKGLARAEDGVKLLLDPEKLLGDEDMDMFSDVDPSLAGL